jgi:hypothetical protein
MLTNISISPRRRAIRSNRLRAASINCMRAFMASLLCWAICRAGADSTLSGSGCEENGALILTPFVLLSVVSMQLVRIRKGALRFTTWLLGGESLGAVFFVVGGATVAGRVVDPLAEFAVGCVVLVLWTAPNAFAFYKARALFTEPANEKPGD